MKRKRGLNVIAGKYWRIGLIGLALLLIGALAACNVFSRPEKRSPFGYHALKINGAFVSPEIFFKEKNSFFMRWRRNADMLRKSEEEKTDMVLDEIINRVLIENHLYNHAGLTVTPQEVNDYINRYIKSKYAATADFSSFMLNAGYKNESELQKGIELYLLKLKCFSAMAKGAGFSLSITDLDSLHQKHIDENSQAVTRHILIADPNRKKAKQRAAEVYRQLENGADFGVLAGRFSADDATKSTGGAREPIVKAVCSPLVAEKVFKARPGSLIPPIENASGYEIIKVDRLIGFYHPKDEFADMTLMRRFGESEQFKTWIAGIRATSSIEILDPAMKAYRLYCERQYDRAGALYYKSFRKRQNELHLQRAVESYQMAKNWEKVIRLCQTGMRKYPEKITYHLNKAEGLYRQGRVDDALVLLKNAESRSRGNPYFKGLLLETYGKLGLTAEMLKMEDSALE